jgi:hypothetical protein
VRLVSRAALEFHVTEIVTLAPEASEPLAGDTASSPACSGGTEML